ncbi:hypothetical protein [Streptomyces sp. LN704]|uniref:hypothetical protein n=1 Tax=Streptomyces sp. LN704 TaxID=3112982 RepID=UPI003715C54A
MPQRSPTTCWSGWRTAGAHGVAYVYLQAREIDRQVVGHLDSWFEPKRKELFRLMFALTDSALMELKRTKNELTDRLNARNTEHANVGAFLAASDPRSDDELEPNSLSFATPSNGPSPP